MDKVKNRKEEDRQLCLFSEKDFEDSPSPGHDRNDTQQNRVHLNQLPNKRESSIPSTRTFDHSRLFNRLLQSNFRKKFHLTSAEVNYIESKGLSTIRLHAADFVAKRLAPAVIPNDGKQTPMRGHPVFIAQHATGCCCRGCFAKWHHIPAGRMLTSAEQEYVVSVLMTWIERDLKRFRLLFDASPSDSM